MKIRLYLPIHHRGFNWNLFIKLINRHYPARHLLRSGPLPLRIKNGSSVCHFCCNVSLISSIHWNSPKWTMNKNSIYNYIYWSQYNIFSSTLSRTQRNTTPILWLSRYIHNMKHIIIHRSNNLFYCSPNIYFYYMGLNNNKTTSNLQKKYKKSPRMRADIAFKLSHI